MHKKQHKPLKKLSKSEGSDAVHARDRSESNRNNFSIQAVHTATRANREIQECKKENICSVSVSLLLKC